jgi:hypothetical protein
LRLKRAGLYLVPAKENHPVEKKKKPSLNPINMQKGKTLTLLVLVVEIASIVILHAVKINQSEKTAVKEAIRNSAVQVSDARGGSDAHDGSDSHQKGTYSFAAFK